MRPECVIIPVKLSGGGVDESLLCECNYYPATKFEPLAFRLKSVIFGDGYEALGESDYTRVVIAGKNDPEFELYHQWPDLERLCEAAYQDGLASNAATFGYLLATGKDRPSSFLNFAAE